MLRQEKSVLLAFGDGHRYDLAFDEAGVLRRVQCKTGRLVGGAVRFSTASVGRITQVRKHYVGAVDFFGVYCPALDKTYLVPIEELGTVEATLRVEAPRNAQRQRIRLAAEYEI